MQRPGQGSFEYILMLSGVILTVVMILIILQGSVANTNNTLVGNQNAYSNVIEIDFVNHHAPNLYVAEPSGGVNNTPCCTNQVVPNQRCFGPYNANATRACNVNISCSSRYFNNATGKCG